MGLPVSYDGIADWYEHVFLAQTRKLASHPLGIDRLLCSLLGSGEGPCLEVGCGTGTWAELVHRLGWTPLGLDISAGMLHYARDRLPVVRADATHLPFASSSFPAAMAVMVHTDTPRYGDVLHEVARVLRPGAVFVHIGVHPCFCGGFADRSTPDAVVVSPGYLDSNWTTRSSASDGLRDKVGAWHLPLPDLFNAFINAGLSPQRILEGDGALPTVLAARCLKASRTP